MQKKVNNESREAEQNTPRKGVKKEQKGASVFF